MPTFREGIKVLTNLHIENIAVIERADVEFGPGFNVLTGETGAGKSIVIDAIMAVLGGRTSRGLVRTGADRATVTAVFTGTEADAWCLGNCIEPEGDMVLQRVVGADGKSSCRVNGVPISAAQLRLLGAVLLDMHGQNDGLKLLDEGSHLACLDSFGDHAPELKRYKEEYLRWRDITGEIDRLNMDEIEKARLSDSLHYQIDELERANIREGEADELKSRRDLMRNAGKLTELLEGAYGALYAGEPSAAGLAGEAEKQVAGALAWAPELRSAAENIREAAGLLEDAAERVLDLKETLDFSPEEYDAIETRLNELTRLFRKYSCDEAGLVARLDECRRRLDELEYSDDRLEKLRAEQEKHKKTVLEAARALSAKRETAGKKLASRIESELHELAMPSARFETHVGPLPGDPGFGPGGMDRVSFLMSANIGESLGPISRIASGGELSRVMLAMKNVLGEKDAVPTLVFDEIDAGVSGVAAQRVAEKLGRLSMKKQVLCVTHLPQIAAMADAQFLISKEERGGRTYTDVKKLGLKERAAELSRLHGGDLITEMTLASAEEQLKAAADYKAGLAGAEDKA